MQIFISWSGLRSKMVAERLRTWLPDIVQNADPWMSSSDIDAGARWTREIQKKLDATDYGIICLTKENLSAPWLLFESGALAKRLDSSFVVPYLIDLKISEIPQGPLSQFQAKLANEIDTLSLVGSIYKTLDDKKLGEDQLSRAFSKWWPDLNEVLSNLPYEEESSQSARTLDDMVGEILSLVRSLHRNHDGGPAGRVRRFLEDRGFRPNVANRAISKHASYSLPEAIETLQFIIDQADVIERNADKPAEDQSQDENDQ